MSTPRQNVLKTLVSTLRALASAPGTKAAERIELSKEEIRFSREIERLEAMERSATDGAAGEEAQ